jgi:hypothetical protein
MGFSIKTLTEKFFQAVREMAGKIIIPLEGEGLGEGDVAAIPAGLEQESINLH